MPRTSGLFNTTILKNQCFKVVRRWGRCRIHQFPDSIRTKMCGLSSTRQSNPHFTRSGCCALTQLGSAWCERLLTDGDWRSSLQPVLSVSSFTFLRRTHEYLLTWLQLPVTGRIDALLGIEQLERLVAVLLTRLGRLFFFPRYSRFPAIDRCTCPTYNVAIVGFLRPMTFE